MRGFTPRYSRPAAFRGQIMRSVLIKGYKQAVLAAFAADGRQPEAAHTPHRKDILGIGGFVGGLQRQDILVQGVWSSTI